MDTWIISDSDFAAQRICDSLRRQQLDCDASHILDAHAIGRTGGPIAGASGIVFVSTSQFNDSHLTLVACVRGVVAPPAKIVVIASGADHSIVLKAVRAGANDVLNADGSLDNELADFIARVRLESQRTSPRGRVLTIVPCHASSDANVLTVNIAAWIALQVKSCGALDFHFRGGDLAILLKLEPRHTIVDLLNLTEPIDEAMFRQALTDHECGLQLLAGPTSFGGMKYVGLQACQQIISLAQQCWPVVVINCEDVQHAEQIRALAVSDDVILTTRLDVASLHRTQKHVEFLAHGHVPRERIHVVAMATGHAGELPTSSVKKVLQLSHVHCIPDDPVANLKSINVGNPLILEVPGSKAATAIKKLTDAIVGPLGDKAAPSGRRSATAAKGAALLTLSALPFCR